MNMVWVVGDDEQVSEERVFAAARTLVDMFVAYDPKEDDGANAARIEVLKQAMDRPTAAEWHAAGIYVLSITSAMVIRCTGESREEFAMHLRRAVND